MEPGVVSAGQSTGFCLVEVVLPGEKLARSVCPEVLGVLNGLFVELLVLIEVCEVGLAVLAGACVSLT